MARRSDSSLAAVLLMQRLVDVPAEPLKSSEYWSLLDAVSDVASLLGRDAADIAAAAGIEQSFAERVAQRFDASTALAFALDELDHSGWQVVVSLDDDYPDALRQKLGKGAPPLLYTAGDAALLRGDLLGIVGSRDISDDGATVARAATRAAVGQGLGIVSGAALGVDRLAMQEALAAGGTAVGVLADSLIRTTRDPEVRRAITDGELCLCSPYQPTASFSVANAMGRNKVIYALSQATFVVASDLELGGTWAGATEALQRSIAPVLVWTGAGAGPGNEQLVDLGATSVGSIDDLFPLTQRARSVENNVSEQLALEV